MYVNAFQSFLWNECVKELLKKNVGKQKLYWVEYAVGSLLFYTDLSDQERKTIPQTFPTISDYMKTSADEELIIQDILVKEGLKLTDFAIESETGNFFKTRKRQVLLFPEGFILSPPQQDELNNKNSPKRYKIQVSFSLPKASYATIVTKRLFGH